MKRLGPEDCERIGKEDRRRIGFPNNGVEVVIKKLSLEDVAAVQGVVGTEETDKAANDEGDVWIASLAIVNDDGTQPYNSDEGRANLRKLPTGMYRKISRMALGMIGLDGVALKNC